MHIPEEIGKRVFSWWLKYAIPLEIGSMNLDPGYGLIVEEIHFHLVITQQLNSTPKAFRGICSDIRETGPCQKDVRYGSD
jgi:hypothetical protein